jgi:hypothetical protein
MSMYRIETRFGARWGDAEWAEDAGGGPIPLVFASREEAQIALDNFFAEVSAAVTRGDLDIPESSDDYRVVQVRD